jgi:hypothetical protein
LKKTERYRALRAASVKETSGPAYERFLKKLSQQNPAIALMISEESSGNDQPGLRLLPRKKRVR